MQIGDSSFDHFGRGHCLIDGASSRLEHDGIEFHGLFGRVLLFLRGFRGVGVDRHVLIVQFHGAFALQQGTRVIDIALDVALVAFDAHLVRVDLGLGLVLLLLSVLRLCRLLTAVRHFCSGQVITLF